MLEDNKMETPMPEEGEDKTKENETEEQDTDIKSALAQKEHFRTKFEKSEAEKEELKKKLDELSVGKDNEKPSNASNKNIEEVLEGVQTDVKKITFAQAHPDIEPSDINEIFSLAKLHGKTPDEELKSPIMDAYLKARQAEIQAKNAAVNSSRSTKGSNGKPYSELSTDERKAHTKELWEKAVRGEL